MPASPALPPRGPFGVVLYPDGPAVILESYGGENGAIAFPYLDLAVAWTYATFGDVPLAYVIREA